MWQSHLISHSFPVPVSRSLQVPLLASQPTEWSRLLGGSPVESLQSHMILTMSHWSSGLTCLLPATRVTGSNPLGGLTWNRDSPVSVVSPHPLLFTNTLPPPLMVSTNIFSTSKGGEGGCHISNICLNPFAKQDSTAANRQLRALLPRRMLSCWDAGCYTSMDTGIHSWASLNQNLTALNVNR